MRTTMLLIALSFLLSSISGQTPVEGANSSPAKTASAAAIRFAALNALHAERMKAIDKQDEAARTKATDTHVTELSSFLRTHGNTTEGNRVRLKLGFMAARNSAYIDAARIALNGFVPSASQAGAGLMAARAADRLQLTETKAKIIRSVSDNAKTITAKVDLVIQLKFGMKDVEWASQLMTEIEAMAKTDEQKAELLMGKANLVRAKDSKDEAGYNGALKNIAATYPATAHGKLASNKLASAKLSVGSTPIAISVKDIEGHAVSLNDYKGKVLLVDFWATWCIPCMKEVPIILAAYDKYEDQGFEVLGISLDRDSQRSRFEAKIVEHGMRWRHVCDGMHWKAKVAQQYDVSNIPFTILIGRDGKIAGLNLHGEQLGRAIQDALNRSK
ncbi:MAG: peroxiredoxin [Planctomycetota bacterium]|jgi:peroxiredoxin